MNERIHGDLTEKIIGSAFEVHNELGSGFLEGVYEEALCIELWKKGIDFEEQKELEIVYKNKPLKHTYKADLLVGGKIIVELKATSGLTNNDEAQLVNYLKASGIKVGLLINFGLSKLEIRRRVY